MMNIIRLALIAIFTGIILVMARPGVFAYDLLGNACKNAANSTACQEKSKNGGKNQLSGPGGVINTAATIVALIAGIAAVIIIIISGLNFATSGGNAEKATKARGRLVGALIGLVVVALAWVIVNFAVSHFIK